MDDVVAAGPLAQRDPGLAIPDYGSILGSASRLLDHVDRALSRLDRGTYHSCVVCGDPIGAARHANEPLTDRCENHSEPLG
jgi:hypothetical protein